MAAHDAPPRRYAWILNLDADLELAVWPRRFEPKRSVRAAVAAYVPVVRTSLLGPEDRDVEELAPASGATRLRVLQAHAPPVGRAFCPTPNALARLARAGIAPEPSPPVAVLRAVNSRVFCASLGSTMDESVLVTDVARAEELLASHPRTSASGTWRVKRPFGMTGRGQCVVTPGPLRDAERSLVRAGIADGGVMIEPNVAIEAEYAIHGILAPSGALRLGVLVAQRCDARGAWLSSHRLLPSDRSAREHDIARVLEAEAEHVARGLSAAGYFGPFGIDAFAFRDAHGGLGFQRRSEINARYSMGFGIGVGVGIGAPSSSRDAVKDDR